MHKFFTIFLLLSIGCLIPSFLFAQPNDFGAIGSLSLSKDIGRSWGLQVEQELRLNQNLRTLDRSLTAFSLDYSIVKKLLKAGLDYNFIYQHQNKYFEIRHRFSASLNAQMSIYSFDFELRTRGQSTWRDESIGNYKFNPKYVWRNRLEGSYSIFGSPVKPFLSVEAFCPLNSEYGFFMDGYRLILGTKYRISKHTTLEFFLRYDQDIQQPNPQSIIYGGVGWNYKL